MKKIISFIVLGVLLFADNSSLSLKEKDVIKKIAVEASKKYISILKNSMKKELNAKGPEAAINYCNANAYPLTMQISVKLSRKYKIRLKLRRTSFKYRDVADAPTSLDSPMLRELKNNKKNIVIKTYKRIINVYTPIYVKKVCLECHGKHLSKDVVKTLNKFYEHDKARDYNVGDFRGAVIVTIDKNSLDNFINRNKQ